MTPFTTAVWVCTLTVMVTSPSCDAGSVLTFTASPATVKPNFTRQVTMRCQLAENQARTSSSDLDLDHVTQMAVLYNDHDYVAVVTKNEPAHGYVDEGNLRVSGNASGLGFLQLTWSDPSALSMGSYTCLMDGKAKGNQFVSLKKGLRLTSEEPSMVDLLERINQNEKDQELKLQEQQQTITGLKTKLSKCSQQVNFQARVTYDQTLEKGQTLVYRLIVNQMGAGYNKQTGIFTCQTPGTYVFLVNGLSGKGFMLLGLYHNNDMMASLYGSYHDNDQKEAASMSAVRHLQAGDTVRVKSYGHAVIFNSKYFENLFTGYLVQADGCQSF